MLLPKWLRCLVSTVTLLASALGVLRWRLVVRRTEILTPSSLWPRWGREILLGSLKGAGEIAESGDLIAVVRMASGIREIRSDHSGVTRRLLTYTGIILMPEDELVCIRLKAPATLPENYGRRNCALAAQGKQDNCRRRAG